MHVFTTIFNSYVGILSLFVILFIIGMAGWFYLFFKKKIEQEDKANNR